MAMPAQLDAESPLGPISDRARQFLVVVDGSPESWVAIRFAAGRAAHVHGGGLILFHVIPPGDFQHWMAVAERMREEAREEAEALLGEVASQVSAYAGLQPDVVIREGQPKEELQAFIEDRDDVFVLILGANAEGDPGPLVDYFSGPLVGSLKCPVMIVPGAMSNEAIDAMV